MLGGVDSMSTEITSIKVNGNKEDLLTNKTASKKVPRKVGKNTSKQRGFFDHQNYVKKSKSR